MKKNPTILAFFILAIVLIVVLIVHIREQNRLSGIKTVRPDGQSDCQISAYCQPCNASSIIDQARRIIESPQTRNFRAGRSVNLSDACKRYNCGRIIPICYTYCNEEAKRLEENLLKEIGLHPKCENIALDARGKMSKKGLPNFIYIKTIESPRSA
jgi:hypothetical protein